MDGKNYPDSFCCPLTSDLMTDPVVDPEGNTYDRIAIVAWLKDHQTSPITRNPLQAKDLVSNRALKASIDLYFKAAIGKINDTAVKDVKELVKKEVQLEAFASKGYTMITVRPPDKIAGITRTPADICCVIDTSGSMSTAAQIQTTGGQNEAFGLTILDLVKHAVKTIIFTLDANDRLSIVKFSTKAEVVLNLTKMDQIGKNAAEAAIDKMVPESSTNLWAGLETGLDVLREGYATKNSAVFILTDGEPNVIPPKGHLPMLEQYKEKHKLPGIINTFGFGYKLDSKLLSELAICGNGAYSFIPDGGFVGTILVNALGNLLSTFANNVSLKIELDMDLIDTGLIQSYHPQITAKNIELKLGSLLFGQVKQIVLPITYKGSSKTLKTSLMCEATVGYKTISRKQEIQIVERDDPQVTVQKFRLEFIADVTRAFDLTNSNNIAASMKIVNDLIKKIKNSPVKDEKVVKALLLDLEEQVTLSLSREDYFKKWGKHYLPSLIRAHLLQQCNNFKDPGVQNYGGELFKEVRDKIDEIFIKIPPPSHAEKITTMDVFYDQYGGCIDGDCLVTMADGTTKFVKDIQKTDEIMGPSGQPVRVCCVVKTLSNNNKPLLVQLKSGLRITPWHPVRIGEKYYFPCTLDYEEYGKYDCPAVYTFVLESEHLILINGVECLTLGHGFQEDVAKHPYFGSAAVMKDLQRLEGWNNGLVELTKDWFKKDLKTGLVSSIAPPKVQVQINHVSPVRPTVTS